MYDWPTLTIEALRQLGAEDTMVPGAKLRAQMDRIGAAGGFDVASYVLDSPYSFAKLVERVEGVTVRTRPGSDVLVGVSGAQVPAVDQRVRESKSRYGGLRSDIFQAFTRVSKVPFVYLPDSDRFVSEDRAEGLAIGVDGATLEGLISTRRDFVNTLRREDQEPLLNALENSSNPLSDFRREVSERGMLVSWSATQTKVIKHRVLEWAKRNNLTPRSSWFQRPHVGHSPHRTLARLIPHLTASEIRDLRIPFTAIEAFLDELNDR